MENNYVKKFDEKYSQLREAKFIQYLNQRGAKVPRLISDHPEKKILKLEYVGDSLDKVMESNYENKKFNLIHILKILRESVDVSYKISQLDVWHFDLALRNFTIIENKVENNHFPSIYLIDFSAAISSFFTLQKPLWLRPDTTIHHKALVKSLERDWIVFFKKNSLSVPEVVNKEFTIPIELYNNYWSSSFAVQELTNPLCIISHSMGMMISNFFVNFSNLLPDLSDDKKFKIKKIAESLTNLDSTEESNLRINKLINQIDSIILDLESNNDSTPRPKSFSSNNRGGKRSLNENRNYLSINKFFFAKRLIGIFILIIGFILVDSTYYKNNIFLTDYAFYVSLISISAPFFFMMIFCLVGKLSSIFNSILRIEASLLIFYFFELLKNQTSWLTLSSIFAIILVAFFLTFDQKKL